MHFHHHHHHLLRRHLAARCISAVTHSVPKARCGDFNNYGAEPNSELFLGCGLTLPANSDDAILKIGIPREVALPYGAVLAAPPTLRDAIDDVVKKAHDDEHDEVGGAGVADQATSRTMTERFA
jgi:hypothetical protein